MKHWVDEDQLERSISYFLERFDFGGLHSPNHAIIESHCVGVWHRKTQTPGLDQSCSKNSRFASVTTGTQHKQPKDGQRESNSMKGGHKRRPSIHWAYLGQSRPNHFNRHLLMQRSTAVLWALSEGRAQFLPLECTILFSGNYPQLGVTYERGNVDQPVNWQLRLQAQLPLHNRPDPAAPALLSISCFNLHLSASNKAQRYLTSPTSGSNSTPNQSF